MNDDAYRNIALMLANWALDFNRSATDAIKIGRAHV